MAYRKIKEEPRIHRVLQDITTENCTLVQNGATAYLAIPCWYQEVNFPERAVLYDRDSEDHLGWPDPTNVDQSSQAMYCMQRQPKYVYSTEENQFVLPKNQLDVGSMFPIHLRKEGYTGVDVAFLNPPEGLTAEGWIDDTDDWVVRFMIHPMCEAAKESNVDVKYAVFATGSNGSKPRRDIIAVGVLRILSGPIA